jgi:hypothetical protein
MSSAGAQTPSPVTPSLAAQVHAIQRADYEGDRAALQRLHAALLVPRTGPLAARVYYWRGFALWRRAINGFNETPRPPDLAQDLTQALLEFEAARALDPTLIDATVGTIGVLGNWYFLWSAEPQRTPPLAAWGGSLMRAALAQHPDHPRLLWVLGPSELLRGLAQQQGAGAALALYQRGLDLLGEETRPVDEGLEPRWGVPELHMSLAWTYANQPSPEWARAEQHAREALRLVPYWHYVRDILLPQIMAGRAAAAAPTSPP